MHTRFFATPLVMLLLSTSLLWATTTETPWFSVDPARWVETSDGWTSEIDSGTWSRTPNDASTLSSEEPAHIVLDTHNDERTYTPENPSSGDIVHTEASMLFMDSSMLPELNHLEAAQGALTLCNQEGILTFFGLAQGEWIPLHHPSITPSTNAYTRVRITLDYSEAIPTVSYAIWDGESYATLSDTHDTTVFATGVPTATNITSIGFSGQGHLGTFSGSNVTLTADPAPEPYSIYFNLDEDTAGFFLGDNKNYGTASWETVLATSPHEALVLAAEQKYGPGAISIQSGAYGMSINSIYGMNGFGGILFSQQDLMGYGDIYFYPIQWVLENGQWIECSSSIPSYTGESRTFALTFQPTAWDQSPTDHTFDDPEDAIVYDLLKTIYNWSGWSPPTSPNFAVTNLVILPPTSAELRVGETLRLIASVLPDDALNPNVTWDSSAPDIATVSSDGIVTALAPGFTTLTATSIDGGLTASCIITTLPAPQGITQDGISLGTQGLPISFSSINPTEGTLTLTGDILGAIGSSSTFTLCYSTTLGGTELTCTVTLTILENQTALIQGIPTDLPAFFALGLSAAP